jgi:hypothetical protein
VRQLEAAPDLLFDSLAPAACDQVSTPKVWWWPRSGSARMPERQ